MRRAEYLLLAGMLVTMTGCGTDGPPEMRAIPVRTRIVEPDAISRTVVAPCRLEGAEEAVLSVATPASVTAVLVTEGDRVEEGEVLVTLETDGMHEAEVAAAAARMTAARAARDYQSGLMDRTASLYESGAVSRSAYEQAEASRRSAEATAGLAQAGYSLALSEASLGQVRAPFSGTVARVWAREGNPASGNLIALTDGDVLEAELHMAPLDLADLVPGLPVFLETPILPGVIFEGSITSVSPSIDQISGTASARAQFTDPTGRLRAGMGCTATVTLESVSSSIVVPQSAMVRTQEGGWSVAGVEGGIARFRDIQVGIRNGFSWQVLSGLSEGDTLITMGINIIEDGDRVREAGI
jgi:RND family efflux transporter MFP subunit